MRSLAGLTVVELPGSLAVRYSGRLFVEAGARVVRIGADRSPDASTAAVAERAFFDHGKQAAPAGTHMDPPALERLRIPDDRLRELLRLAGELRSAMAAGEGVDGVGVQSLVAAWESLLDEFSSNDAAIKDRMHQALHADVVLQRRWALDPSLMEFVQRARNVGLGAKATHGRA